MNIVAKAFHAEQGCAHRGALSAAEAESVLLTRASQLRRRFGRVLLQCCIKSVASSLESADLQRLSLLTQGRPGQEHLQAHEELDCSQLNLRLQ